MLGLVWVWCVLLRLGVGLCFFYNPLGWFACVFSGLGGAVFLIFSTRVWGSLTLLRAGFGLYNNAPRWGSTVLTMLHDGVRLS